MINSNKQGIKQTAAIHYNVFIVGASCKKTMQETYIEDAERIKISICRKAYDALVTYTRQVNEKESDTGNKPFTIEEVLDEEIIFLFSDEWKKG